MANPVVVADVESRWRPLTVEETVVASTKIDDAWNLLVLELPSLDANLTAGTVLASTVKMVVADMVIRHLKNPDGWERESLDDWSGQRAATAADGSLYATAEELRYLQPIHTQQTPAYVVGLGG